MGRTVPSFRIALYQEETRWKNFRAALDKKEMNSFDDMIGIAKLYISACMMACRPVRIESILMAIIFHHFEQISCLVGDPIEHISKR